MQNMKARKPGPTHSSTVSSSDPRNWKKVQSVQRMDTKIISGLKNLHCGATLMEHGLSTLEKTTLWRDLRVFQYLKDKKGDRGSLFTRSHKEEDSAIGTSWIWRAFTDRRFFLFPLRTTNYFNNIFKDIAESPPMQLFKKWLGKVLSQSH